jgi:hypothetical protein
LRFYSRSTDLQTFFPAHPGRLEDGTAWWPDPEGIASPSSRVARFGEGLAWVKLVVDGILGMVPEFKGRFCHPGPRQIVQRDLQMLRENSQQLDLFFHIQLVNGCADFEYTAHAENLSPDAAKSKLRTHHRESSLLRLNCVRQGHAVLAWSSPRLCKERRLTGFIRLR